MLGSSSSHEVNSTGGEETHTLTGAESGQKAVTVPSAGEHTHPLIVWSQYSTSGNYGPSAAGGYANTWSRYTATYENGAKGVQSAGAHTHSIAASNATSAHNNMPPYKSVYIWERTE